MNDNFIFQEKSFCERGYDALIYDVLMKLIIKEHKSNLKKLLSNMATVLDIMDQSVSNKFEVRERSFYPILKCV